MNPFDALDDVQVEGDALLPAPRPSLAERFRVNREQGYYTGTLGGAVKGSGTQAFEREQAIKRFDALPQWETPLEGLTALAGQLSSQFNPFEAPENFVPVGLGAKVIQWSGGALKSSARARVAAGAIDAGATNLVLDSAIQGIEIGAGTRETFDPVQLAASTAMGAGVGAVGAGLSRSYLQSSVPMVDRPGPVPDMAPLEGLDLDAAQVPRREPFTTARSNAAVPREPAPADGTLTRPVSEVNVPSASPAPVASPEIAPVASPEIAPETPPSPVEGVEVEAPPDRLPGQEAPEPVMLGDALDVEIRKVHDLPPRPQPKAEAPRAEPVRQPEPVEPPPTQREQVAAEEAAEAAATPPRAPEQERADFIERFQQTEKYTPAIKGPDGKGYRMKSEDGGSVVIQYGERGQPPRYIRPPEGETWTPDQAANAAFDAANRKPPTTRQEFEDRLRQGDHVTIGDTEVWVEKSRYGWVGKEKSDGVTITTTGSPMGSGFSQDGVIRALADNIEGSVQDATAPPVSAPPAAIVDAPATPVAPEPTPLADAAERADIGTEDIADGRTEPQPEPQPGQGQPEPESGGLRQEPRAVSEGEQAGDAPADGAGRQPEGIPDGDRGAGGGDARLPDEPADEGPQLPDRVSGEGGGAGGSGSPDGRTGGGRSDPPASVAEVEAAKQDARPENYRITEADRVGQGGGAEKIRANIEAIRTLQQIEAEARPATIEEKRILVRYVGWGAFAQDVFADHKPQFKAERQALRDILSPEEYDSARASTLNAHYTSPEVIKGMWEALGHMGFKGGRVLEPSSGVGHFLGLQPDALHARSNWSLVELDSLTGRIAKALYSASDVNVQGFETFKRPKDFYDLAISNVPFGNFKLPDKTYPPLPIHDYFFVKSLDLVRPGGVVSFITSSFTMDKMGDRARTEINKRADFLGAIRLPGGNKGAFAGNAGTEVTTDIIFLRARAAGEPPSADAKPWMGVKEIETPEGGTMINEYFAANPQMMLGEMRLTGTMYAAKQPVLVGETADLAAKIAAAAKAGLPENAVIPRDTAPREQADITTDAAAIKEGAFFEQDGKLWRKVAGVGVDAALPPADAGRVKRLMGLRDIVNALLEVQIKGIKDEAPVLRGKLNKAYDAFVKAHGPINLTDKTVTSRLNSRGEPVVIRKQPNTRAFVLDPDAYKVLALENYDEDSGKATKAAIFTTDVIGAPAEPKIAGPADAVAVSLNAKGRIDTDYLSGLMGKSPDEVVRELGDLVFVNPKGDELQAAGRYLSGDVVTKLEEARQAAKTDPRFRRNVAELERVQPTPLTRADVRVTLGAPWVPAAVYEDFIAEEIGSQARASLNPYTKAWSVSGQFYSDAQAKYGTERVNVKDIIEAAMNQKPIRVYDKHSDGSRSLNPAATEEAAVKIRQLREVFGGDVDGIVPSWVWKDDDRAGILEDLYNASFNRIVSEKFDGSALTLAGIATNITGHKGLPVPFKLNPHQKNAVWRITQNGSTLLDHSVGAGKTYTMIAAGMEQKRLGLIERPMYVVPNHMLEQFSREFLQAYPAAKILVAQKEEMTKANRKAFVAKVAAEKWDGIVITHDAFGRIPLSQEVYKKHLEDEIDEVIDAIRVAREEEGKSAPTVKQLEKAKKNLETKLSALINEGRKDEGVLFEETGVDFLFVDEAHLFKNLSFHTRHTNVQGMAQGNAQRATDLFLKVKQLDARRPGRAAVFATGTPVSNTMAELYTMQRYLQPSLLKQYGVEKFDAWASTFGEIVTNMQLSADGRTLKEKTSFSRFNNVPELVTLYSQIADTQTAETLNLQRPEIKGGKGIVVESEPSPREEEYIRTLIARAEAMKGKRAEKGGDNMLKIVGEGRKIATDIRLIDSSAAMNPDGKVAKAVENIHRIWKEGKEPGLAQMVFLDMGVPQTARAKEKPKPSEDTIDIDEDGIMDVDPDAPPDSGYDLYEDMRGHLVSRGIPKEQIAFIHEADNDMKKGTLFKKVREGKVRVLIGSTSKMGVGTNAQTRLIAMHELDAPWKPAEVEQRNGRILRQGNMNKEIELYRYITKRSFDAFMWQTLERKAKFISQVRAGARGVRHAEDIDSPLPDAAMLKAAASGDPRIMQHAELSKELRNLDNARAAHLNTIAASKRAERQLVAEIAHLETELPKVTADIGRAKDTAGDKFEVELAIEPKGQNKERAAAGNAIRDHLIKQGEAYNFGKPIVLGKIGDFTMEAVISTRQYVGDLHGVVVQPVVRGDSYYSPEANMLITSASDGVGIMRRFENLMLAPAQRERAYIAALTSKRDSLVKTREQTADRPFPKQALLDAAREKFKRLENDLRPKEPGKAEAVPPPADDTLAMAVAPPDDPLLDPEGAWRDETVSVEVDGRPAVVRAGDAVDFLNQRIKAVRQLLDCINAS